MEAIGPGGLWQPVPAKPNQSDKAGRFDRSNSLDSNSSDGCGFNAREGSGLYDSLSPDSLYGSSSPTESVLEALSMPPPLLTRSASQPNPPPDSYLYSPFKSGATSTSAPHSEHKLHPRGESFTWAESFQTISGEEDRGNIQNRASASIQQKEAPLWLSRNDSASSGSSYGAGSRPVSYGSVEDGLDDDVRRNHVNSGNAQSHARPLSGRRAAPLMPLSPMSKLQLQEPSRAAVQQTPMQTHSYENDHDRRPIPVQRPAVPTSTAPVSSALSDQVLVYDCRFRPSDIHIPTHDSRSSLFV
jgi:hypothetical protein